ncbi:ThiF family adenylyltransferase [Guptibacillus hwajinpoensis]|uniref:Thiamine biosynthesis protein ThiF n=1 Tax=Guptibacillus hwajinpoensis TaxID=208199 RepID=A0A0J6CXB0_9BACL|nr:ThiF family adenylyltransferase [Alkalihalobacillus macyae]KMM37825.1 thiamine biosynthesis protein ThiF [Alkalihalobacillus macyae]
MGDFKRYSRQMLFSPIGEEGQNQFSQSSALIVGMGALGTAIANHLVRAGFGYVRIVDRDYVEQSNLQRQMLFDEEDVAASLPKTVAAKKKLEKMNSSVTIDAVTADVNAGNIMDLLDGIDFVMDGTDNFSTRFLLNDACFKENIPFVYGGAVSSRGMTALFVPEETPCLRCFIQSGEGSSGETCDTIGVISPIVDMIASYQVTEIMKYVSGAHDQLHRSLLTMDIWNNHRYAMKFSTPKEGCPTCQKREYPALQGGGRQEVTSLCGRETIQIHLEPQFDLQKWATKLEKTTTVKKTPFLLRVQLEEGERLVLFPDGRVLIQGTEDSGRAKALYARYIGM